MTRVPAIQTSLMLNNNYNLEGTIPHSLSSLSLKEFDISINLFNGTIPSFFFNMPSLAFLNLYRSALLVCNKDELMSPSQERFEREHSKYVHVHVAGHHLQPRLLQRGHQLLVWEPPGLVVLAACYDVHFLD